MNTPLKSIGAAVCVAALAFVASTAHAQNLLVDPGFENQTPIGSGGWNLFGGAAFSNAHARTGTFSMSDTGGGGFFNPGSFETFATSAGQKYELTGYGFAPTAPGAGANFGILQITFFSGAGGTGTNLGSIDISTGGNATGVGNAQTSSQINASSPTGQWIFLDTGIAQAPAGSQSVQAFTLVVEQNPTSVFFDDLSLIKGMLMATPTITWTNPAAITYGAALGTIQLNASANVPGTFVYYPPSGTVLASGMDTLSATFTPTDTNDYNRATNTVTQLVNQATLTVTANNTNRPIGQTNPVFTGTITGLQNGDNITATYACNAISKSTIGQYDIIPTLVDPNGRLENYHVTTNTGTLTVTKIISTINWATPAPITYGTLLSTTQLNAEADAPGHFTYIPAGGTLLNAGTASLSAVFTPNFPDIYTGPSTNNVVLQVMKAPLTVNVGNASRPLGRTNPILAGTISGLVNNDNITATYSSAAAANSVAGTYPILPNFIDLGGRLTNYQVMILGGTLTVTAGKATPVIAWPTPTPITYGTALSGTQLDAGADVTGSFIYNPPSAIVLNAGMQSLTAVFIPTDSAGYVITTNNVPLQVTPAPLTVTAANQNRFYGQTNPIFTGTITGLANNDNITAAYTCAANTNSLPGIYPIIPTLIDPGARLPNYQAITNNGTLAVAVSTLTELAQNGGFESGDFTDWILSGNTGGASVSTNTLYIHSGTYGAQLGLAGSLGSLFQFLYTEPKQIYALTFWLNSPNGASPNEFVVSWNGTNIYDQTNLAAIGWTNIIFTNLLATAISTPLQFGFRNNTSSFGLDDVIVTNTAPASTSSAAYTFTTIAGFTSQGSADGVGPDAQFSGPAGIAVDRAGNAYVMDAGNYTIRKITPAGVVTTIAGAVGYHGSDDGVGAAARFGAGYGFGSEDVAVDNAGNLYVADGGNNTIRKVVPVGSNWMVTTIAGLARFDEFGNPETGTNDGVGSAIQFNFPNGLAVDSATNIFVADQYNATIRKLTLVGTNWVSSTIAGMIGESGTADGGNGIGEFESPTGLALDPDENIYVADGAIRKVTPMMLPNGTTNWVITTLTGKATGGGGPYDGIGTNALTSAQYLTLDSNNSIFFTDNEGLGYVRKAALEDSNWVVTTIAGGNIVQGAEGTGTNANFEQPFGIATGTAGILYVTDSVNEEVLKVTRAGLVTTLAGSVTLPGANDGIGSNARFSTPGGVVVDNLGNLYVADTGNNTIRLITSAGIVTTPYGSAGNPGTNDGVGNNARFNLPFGVVLGNAGNLYVADTFNDTIREITPDGTVTTIAGLAGVTGTNDGPGSVARFNHPYDVSADSSTNLYIVDSYNFTVRQMTRSGTNWITSTIAGSPGISGTNDGAGSGARFGGAIDPGIYALGAQGIAVDSATNIYVADTFNQEVRRLMRIGSNWVVSTIATTDTNMIFDPIGVAVNNEDNVLVTSGDNTIRKLTPVGISSAVDIIGGLSEVYGTQDGTGSTARFGSFGGSPEGLAVDSAGNVYVADAGNNTIRKGVFTQYGSANHTPYLHPTNIGALQVTLLPTNAAGQWRFSWEQVWHDSGYTASNLVEGQYPIEFRNITGWIAIPPNQVGTNSIAVPAGTLVQRTNFYFPTGSPDASGIAGSLSVYLGANPPADAGWRFLGDTNVYFPSGFSTNLLPGTYLIEFAGPFSGRATPPNGSAQVFPGQLTQINVLYSIAPPPPANVLLPTPVPASEVSNVSDLPFGFNGRLQSDVGYSSGVVVASNVVLTAAHAIFNDQTLSYVSGAFFFLQEEIPSYAPSPEIARGWFVLSSYASQRTNDVSTPPYGPGISSPQSRNFDVAALYFNGPVADGGFAGYLPSDNVPNQWLTGNAEKILVGYPQDGSIYGFADIANGDMYEIGPQPYPLSLSTDSVTNQQEVYDAAWFLAYPGNSGGPLYVQLNGYYYPAGIYLGTQNNQSVVRAIDSAVTNLILDAAALGDAGTNHNGGGIVTFIPDAAISAFNPAYLQVQLAPPTAVLDGAGWKLQGDSAYANAPNFTRAVQSTSASIAFNPITGWSLPTNPAVSLVAGQITNITATYTLLSPKLIPTTQGLGLTAAANTTYRIDKTTSLTNSTWIHLSTNTITNADFTLVVPKPAGATNTFYRAVRLNP